MRRSLVDAASTRSAPISLDCLVRSSTASTCTSRSAGCRATERLSEEHGVFANAQLGPRLVRRHCVLKGATRALLRGAGGRLRSRRARSHAQGGANDRGFWMRRPRSGAASRGGVPSIEGSNGRGHGSKMQHHAYRSISRQRKAGEQSRSSPGSLSPNARYLPSQEDRTGLHSAAGLSANSGAHSVLRRRPSLLRRC